MMFRQQSSELVSPEKALPGRPTSQVVIPNAHFISAHPLVGPWPDGVETAVFGMGCFWGAERKFWQAPGVYSTAVGYSGGFTPNPSYEEVCSTMTGHTEVVLVAFQTAETSFEQMLKVFWENHNPTQGMRQGNDQGTQYRSAIYWMNNQQQAIAQTSQEQFQVALKSAGYGEISTEIAELKDFFYAESYHQQYLGKNPNGYCGMGGTGVSCSVGIAR
ncbi:MAG: peptide-methionine (S)-S-oxide reductase MsrA [Ilumatobacteraceae bacterium]|nr:peptide-methionine (S)-S-oxide reductase MsrA [Ilumatobacteraceae bacterium]